MVFDKENNRLFRAFSLLFLVQRPAMAPAAQDRRGALWMEVDLVLRTALIADYVVLISFGTGHLPRRVLSKHCHNGPGVISWHRPPSAI